MNENNSENKKINNFVKSNKTTTIEFNNFNESKKASHNYVFSPKPFKNSSLLTEDENNKANTIKNLLKNIKISADTSKVVSQELKKHVNVKWEELGVSKKISDLLEVNGFKFPSPVQYQSVGEIIKGNEVLVRSKNGSGKTLSFIIPALEKVDISKNELQVIILVPIRELALQIARVVRVFCKELNIKSTPLVGGSKLEDDILRVSSGVHILVGTPGRVVDVLERNLCAVSDNPLVIFDEADKLLDATFFDVIHRLLSILNKKKQLCLYSATFPSSVKSFMDMRMHSPKLIKISEEYTLFNVSLFYAIVSNKTRLMCLKSLLNSLKFEQCIIYCNGKDRVELLAQKIIEMGYSCFFISSHMSQDERNVVFDNFLKNRCKILVSTDITTRGTDVHGVNVVINFDSPSSSESFLHRQGRAGRFGLPGCCITLIHESEHIESIKKFADFVGSELLPCSDSSFKQFCKE